MRYKIVVEYLGTNFCGWQNQKNGLSVQEALEKALSELLKTPITVFGSGRTDAGVHALGQTAHFDAATSIPAEKIPFAVNILLPETVKVKSCEVAEDGFHARFDAKKKTYIYKIYISPHSSPLRLAYAEQIPVELDIEAMRKAALYLEGTHDFKAFSSTGSRTKDNIRTVYGVEITRIADEMEIEVTGNGFLYNMVRIIAGTLVDVGKGKIPFDAIPGILLNGDRASAGKTLPPYGLYLKSVEYL